MAKTSYCSSRTELTFSWKAKNYSLFSPRIVRFMAEMSSFTFFCLFARASSAWISSSIQSFSFEGVYFGFTTCFLIEFARLFFSLIDIVSFSLATSFVIYLGGYLGTYYLLLAEFIDFGAILLWEFFGSRICFWFWFWWFLPLYSFFMLPALSILCTYFLGYNDFGSGFVSDS